MSSLERSFRRRRLLGRDLPGGIALAFAALASLPLAGCIQPLYGSFSAGGDVPSELQAIKIEPVPDRLGHYLVDDLIFGLNGTGAAVEPKYVLKIYVRENVQTSLVDTVTGYPSSGTIVVSADYTLTPLRGGDPIAKGTATTFASYDRNAQRFANIRASRDAEIRNARLLADQIQTNIAAAFAAKG
jgi:LPS-assembly lipoprotein